MTLEDFIAELRLLAWREGALADESFWAPRSWAKPFSEGLTPGDAWDVERNPALRAL